MEARPTRYLYGGGVFDTSGGQPSRFERLQAEVAASEGKGIGLLQQALQRAQSYAPVQAAMDRSNARNIGLQRELQRRYRVMGYSAPTTMASDIQKARMEGEQQTELAAQQAEAQRRGEMTSAEQNLAQAYFNETHLMEEPQGYGGYIRKGSTGGNDYSISDLINIANNAVNKQRGLAQANTGVPQTNQYDELRQTRSRAQDKWKASAQRVASYNSRRAADKRQAMGLNEEKQNSYF